jgi:hypothetical protein
LKIDGYVEWSPISLKTKWGIIKHDVFKFVGVYGSIISLNESRSFAKDILHKTLTLYKLKHLKNL